MASFRHQTFVKASPEAIWEMLVEANRSQQYGYGGRTEVDLRPGGGYTVRSSEGMRQAGMPEVVIDGEVVEVDAPSKLVHTWHAYFDADLAAEPANRVTVEIEPADPRMFDHGEVSKVTLTHELDGAPITAGIVTGEVAEAGGGWAFILADLKTKLETGTSFFGG